ncbi:MAG: glycosyltransferase family 2 protein [Thermodesulfobacteriota bacterium]|nr:glycosyltransferase family 2 protein [Thermodesulfobacteriota bacterium]
MKPSPNTLVSIVVPVYNESTLLYAFTETLEDVVQVLHLKWEIIFVDDGSTDDTWSVLSDIHQTRESVMLISLSRRFGKDTAVFAGMENARGDAVVVIDADLQDPPEIIPEMIEKWQSGNDIIIGLRQDRQGERFLRKLATRFFYKLIQKISDIDLPPDAGDFCLLDRRVVKEVNRFKERTRYFRGLIGWVGFRRAFVRYERNPRQGGRSKWRYSQLAAFAIDAITSYSRLPLRIWTMTGIGAAMLGFLYGLYVLVYTLITGGDVPGYASLVMIILLLGGTQLISIGVISEYIGHLFIEAKERPLFIVREIKATQKTPHTHDH